MKTMLFCGAALVVATMGACDHEDGHSHDRDPHSVTFPACKAITDACHYVDTGEGPIHDCHDLAHEAKSDEPCAARKDACVALCTADAGGGTDGGVHDAAGGR